jgi:hypothetical protein
MKILSYVIRHYMQYCKGRQLSHVLGSKSCIGLWIWSPERWIPLRGWSDSLVSVLLAVLYGSKLAHAIRNYKNHVTNYYNNMAPPCSSQRQELIARKLIQFIIQFVSPIYILQNQSFREFIHACEPGRHLNTIIKIYICENSPL